MPLQEEAQELAEKSAGKWQQTAPLSLPATTNSISLGSSTQTYIVHMDSAKVSALDRSLGSAKRWHESIMDSLLKLSPHEPQAPPPKLLYVYETALTGFAAKLSADQLESLENLDGFISAYPDDTSITLHTTYSP